MNRQYGWVSEYRRNKFFEGQRRRKEKAMAKSYTEKDIFDVPKTIAVMLDLDGTCDNIDDEKAKTFLAQIDFLRQKFEAQTATISISTHYDNSNSMKKVLDILSRNLPSCVKIGLNFYYGGIYDYERKEEIPKEDRFNSDKVETFTRYFVNRIGCNNQWFAIIDDMLVDTYKKFQDDRPMLAARPSLIDGREMARNNFMSIATMTRGIDGVIEILSTYIEYTKGLTRFQIMEKQRSMITHLSSWDLVGKIRKRDYAYLVRYFQEGFADKDDYSDALEWFFYTNSDIMPSKEELINLRTIFGLLHQHFQTINEQESIAKLLKIQSKFESSSN